MAMLLRIAIALLSSLMVAGMATHAWRQRSFGVACLAAWMTTLSACAWLMVFAIFPNGRLTPMGMLLTGALTTLAGPLLLGYVIYAVRGLRLHWAWFLPFAAHVAGALALGTQFNYLFPTIPVILLEFCYTALGWLVWYRHARPRSGHLAALGVLLAVTSLHLGQALSIVDFLGYTDTRLLRSSPLYIVGAWLVVALVMALVEAPLLRRLVPSWTPPTSDADRELFVRVERLMQDKQPWSDPDFDVGALARLLGTYPNAVSRALGRAGGTTFYEYVNRHRVREAERLLADPKESKFKIEALGRQAGFRARSTFFKLFRQHTGLTPAEYRANRNPDLNGRSSPPAH